MSRNEKTAHDPAFRQHRRALRLKVGDVAKRLNFSASYISGVELGKLKPSKDFLERYADAFGLPPDYSPGEYVSSSNPEAEATLDILRLFREVPFSSPPLTTPSTPIAVPYECYK